MQQSKHEIIEQLRKDILLKQGYKPVSTDITKISGLEQLEAAFPNGVFPTGMIHEFVSSREEHATACRSFISGLLTSLTAGAGICIWISTRRTIYPPALKAFGIEPDQIIFVDVNRDKEALWVTEEALKCETLFAVIVEVQDLSFSQSLRLQLAVEQSKVTGFVLRNDPAKLTPTATVARWEITPLPSQPQGGLPGVGFPRWQVAISKIRNGNPGTWQVEWRGKAFSLILPAQAPNTPAINVRKAG
jgi:protein ImuA